MAESPTHAEHAVAAVPSAETLAARSQSLLGGSVSATEVPFPASVDESYLAALQARDPSVQAVARWFRTDHLPEEALHGDVAREFQAFTLHILDMISDDSVEMTVALRKLLEAKDAAVRAALS